VRDRIERQRQVGAGVAVGHREHVDLVQVRALGDDTFDAGAQRAVQSDAVEVGDAGTIRRLVGIQPGDIGGGGPVSDD
jgi:hypothetical protein